MLEMLCEHLQNGSFLGMVLRNSSGGTEWLNHSHCKVLDNATKLDFCCDW